MRDDNKKLRPWLESWGAWRRLKLNIDFPIESVSCNPDLHIVKPIIEPLFRMPEITYNHNLSPQQNATINAKRLKRFEQAIREFHYTRRTETKPKRTGTIPNYDPHWRMNLIDRTIQELAPRLKEVIVLRYEKEFRVNEIPRIIGRSLDAVDKRLQNAHKVLRNIPKLMVSREAPLNSRREIENHKSEARTC